jgi:hypothetical protein
MVVSRFLLVLLFAMLSFHFAGFATVVMAAAAPRLFKVLLALLFLSAIFTFTTSHF